MANEPKRARSAAAAHAYVHVAKRGGVHPYVKFRSKPTTEQPWAVADLCKAYQWPQGLKGRGVIAIVELGGGWDPSDLDQFFKSAGLPPPHVADVSVDGTQNSHRQPPSGDDAEVALDLEIAAASYAIATGLPATLRVYWSRDITSALQAAAQDGCDVCSISWGADEASWGAPAGLAFEQAAQAATEAGMAIFAAAGDNDSSDGGPTRANVDLPASAPHVIGCGGTKRLRSGVETVWNDNPGESDGEGTGGGFSTLFKPMPSWQAGAPHGPGRMVPDVAANADPDTGYEIVLGGKTEIVGGTSAVAPLYAGLFAAFGEKLGFVTPELYLNPTCFDDIVKGENGAFRAGVGPDPCTGLGSPIGKRLADLFAHPAATSERQLRFARDEIARLHGQIAKMWVTTPPPDPSDGFQYDSSTDSFTRKASPRIVAPAPDPSDNFEYDPSTDSWKRRAS